MDRSFSGAVPTRDRELVERARAKLKDAFEKSKSSFLEEADSIFNSMGKRRTRVTSPLPGSRASQGRDMMRSSWADDDGDFVENSVFSKAASIAKQRKKDSMPVKGKFCASKKPKQIVVSICEMFRRRNSVVKKGDYLTLFVDPQADYDTVVRKGALLLHLVPERCNLCHANGSKIIEDDIEECDGLYPWSIGRYLRSRYAKTSTYKLGILCEERISSESEEERHLEYKNPHKALKITYAPCIGAVGLDLSKRCSREAFANSKGVPLSDPVPLYLELSGYAVCQIKKGRTTLLEYNDEDGYVILNNTHEKHVIVHQSEGTFVLPEDQVITLFCISSTHCWDSQYEWMCDTVPTGVSSPVLYVKRPGLYQCIVTLQAASCTSKEIEVVEERRSGKRKQPKMMSGDSGLSMSSTDNTQPNTSIVSNLLREFTEADLGKMTEEFSNVIGRGSFGCVYKGMFEHTPVAVKVINPKALQEMGNKTFTTELNSLTKFRHPNLINLMGFCQVRAALVYPYMENMSLFHALHEYKVVKPVTWEDRCKILNKTACAVLYLHSSTPPCVHRDIKSHNILLDGALNPYLADFGFLMPLPMTESRTSCLVTSTGSIAIAGTRGYLAPEFMAGKIGQKVDVYSYGIVCLETFTGLLAYSEEREDDQLIDHCGKDLEKLSVLADQKAGRPTEHMVDVFSRVIVAATQKNYKKRSSMEEVIVQWKSLSPS